MIISRLLIGTAFAALAASAATADTVRIAEHRQARIDALTAVVPQLEEATGHTIEVIEYPGPDREYVSKLLTELGAGTGPDIFSLPNIGQVLDFAAAGYMVELSDCIRRLGRVRRPLSGGAGFGHRRGRHDLRVADDAVGAAVLFSS